MPTNSICHLNTARLKEAQAAHQKLFDQKLDFNQEPDLSPKEQDLIKEHNLFLCGLTDHDNAYLTDVFKELKTSSANAKKNAVQILKQYALKLIWQNAIAGRYDAEKRKRLIELLQKNPEDFLKECKRISIPQLKTIGVYMGAVDSAEGGFSKLQAAIDSQINERRKQQAKDIDRGLVYSIADSTDIGMQRTDTTVNKENKEEEPEAVIQRTHSILKEHNVDEELQEFLAQYANQNKTMHLGYAYFVDGLLGEIGIQPKENERFYHIEKRVDGSLAITTVTMIYSYQDGYKDTTGKNPKVYPTRVPSFISHTTLVVRKNNGEDKRTECNPLANIKVEVESCFLECHGEITQNTVKQRQEHNAAQKLRQGKTLSGYDCAAIAAVESEHLTSEKQLQESVFDEKFSSDRLFILTRQEADTTPQNRKQLSNPNMRSLYVKFKDEKAAEKSNLKETIDREVLGAKANNKKEFVDGLVKSWKKDSAKQILGFETILSFYDQSMPQEFRHDKVCRLLGDVQIASRLTQEQLMTLSRLDNRIAKFILAQNGKNKSWWGRLFGRPQGIVLTPHALAVVTAYVKKVGKDARETHTEASHEKIARISRRNSVVNKSRRNSLAAQRQDLSISCDMSIPELSAIIRANMNNADQVAVLATVNQKFHRSLKENKDFYSMFMRCVSAHQQQILRKINSNLDPISEVRIRHGEKINYHADLDLTVEQFFLLSEDEQIQCIENKAQFSKMITAATPDQMKLMFSFFEHVPDVHCYLVKLYLQYSLLKDGFEKLPESVWMKALLEHKNNEEVIMVYQQGSAALRQSMINNGRLMDKLLQLTAPKHLPGFIESDPVLGLQIAVKLVDFYETREAVRVMVDTHPKLWESEQFSRQFLFAAFTKQKVLKTLRESDDVLETIFSNHPQLLKEFAKSNLSEHKEKDSDIKRFIDKVIAHNRSNPEFIKLIQENHIGLIPGSQTPRLSFSGRHMSPLSRSPCKPIAFSPIRHLALPFMGEGEAELDLETSEENNCVASLDDWSTKRELHVLHARHIAHVFR